MYGSAEELIEDVLVFHEYRTAAGSRRYAPRGREDWLRSLVMRPCFMDGRGRITRSFVLTHHFVPFVEEGSTAYDFRWVPFSIATTDALRNFDGFPTEAVEEFFEPMLADPLELALVSHAVEMRFSRAAEMLRAYLVGKEPGPWPDENLQKTAAILLDGRLDREDFLPEDSRNH